MKKFTLFAFLVALISVATFALQTKSFVQFDAKGANAKAQKTLVLANGINRHSTVSKAPRRAAELVTVPTDAEVVTYYTASGMFYANGENGFEDATADMKSVNVAVVGTDIYVQGLAYWFKEGWIKGTIEGTTATFPNGQLIGSDEYGDEFIVGSNDGEAVSDIVFTYDAEAGSLSAVTPLIVESASADAVQAYCYWNSPVFTLEQPAGPEVVTLPEGVELVEYALTYETSAGAAGSAKAAVAVDGDDVYFQGFSSYIPDALIKGTKEGNTITFPANQYLGSYAGYDSYLYVDATFTYDEAADTYSSTDHVYSVLGGQYYDANYFNPVLKPIVEQAAMPANPAITALTNGQYGYYITFNVPNVDVDGNGLVSSKLSYIIYTDVEGEIAPLTFTSATHSRLTEDMTEIPFGFTENYDFYDTQIYLNDLYSSSWNNIGIQSIYRGAGEENVTEIQWYHIKDYAGPSENTVTFNFNKMEDIPLSWNKDAIHDEASTAGDITEAVELVQDNVTLTISPKAEGASTENRFWYTTNGPQLRVYSGTLTFEAPEGSNITKIVFNYNGKYWGGNSNGGDVTADSGEITDDADNKAATWTGEAQTVVFTIGANTQVNSIDVTVLTEPFNPDDIDLPEFVYDFNDGTLQGWTTIDADGDGYNWAIANPNSIGGIDESTAVYSQSYASGVGALTPDNYLVSPKLVLNGCIKFYACAQDASYPAEHFSVEVSTKGNTDAADFETVEEWTLTASRAVKAPRKAQGTWYEYTVDLRGYEGQEGYVAIRHFDVSDQFYIVVDNIALKSSKVYEPDIVVDPVEGIVEALSTVTVTFNNYEVALPEPESAEAELYLNDNFDEPIATAPISLVDGKQLVINFPEQTAKGQYTVVIPDGTVQNVTEEKILSDLEFHYAIYPKELVQLPEGVEAEVWYFTAQSSDGKVKGVEVGVAIDGTDIYVQGINQDYLPEAWVKGTIDAENGTATFEARQYFGAYEYDGDEYDMWFVGSDDGSEINDVVFEYDAENGVLSTESYVIVNSELEEISDYQYYYEVQITREQPEFLEPVVAPEDLVTEAYSLKAFDSYWEEDVNREIEVGFYGENEVYFLGLSEYVEDAWVKGTIGADGVVSIPETYLGVYYSLLSGETDIYFPETEFTYNAEAGQFVSEDGFSTYDDDGYAWDELEDVVITKLVETEATPANPEVAVFELYKTPGEDATELELLSYPNVELDIPTEDIDGNALIQGKLSYVLYIVDAEGTQKELTLTTDLYEALEEDLTEIPYKFTDDWDIYTGGAVVYLNQDPDEIASWKKIGVQSIYRGLGIEHRSEIGWFDIQAYIAEMEALIATGINDLTNNGQKAVIFDLQGRRVAQPGKGLYIVNGKKVVMK